MRFVIDKDGKLLKVEHLREKDKKVVVPDGVTCIGRSSLSYCKAKEIVLPNTLKAIERYAFSNSDFEKINIPSSVTYIGGSAFHCCYNLKEITIPESIRFINDNTFYCCKSLEKVNLPNSLKRIETGAFNGCESLKSIFIPDSIEQIAPFTFAKCESLSNVDIPDSIKSIGYDAFRGCVSLTMFQFPENLEEIDDEAFYYCSALRSIKLPHSIKYIGKKSFGTCENLDIVTIPDTIEEIANNAFFGSFNISSFAFGEEEMTCFNRIEGLVERNQMRLFASDNILDSKYLNMIEDYGNGHVNDDITGSIILATVVDKKDIVKMKDFAIIVPFITRNILTKENHQILLNEIKNNRKEFQKLIRIKKDEFNLRAYHNQISFYELYRLGHTLGAFSDNQVDRQRACEFLINVLDKKMLNFGRLHASFESLNFNGFNEEWAKFFMDRKVFPELALLEDEQIGYIARIYNSFDKIKEFGRSNRGDQHYRKVTVEMCKEYLSKGLFDGVDSSNADIAQTIRFYTKNQHSFDEANKIRKEYLKLKEEGKLKDHLLEEELKENDVFKQIEEERKKVLSNTKETLAILNELANKRFTYEFLSKYDPRNFILGKYCSCCAHIEGAGHGIMKASILHPDCQNLIIKDHKGKIIAKSTLYVNRSQGYGVFNNVEVDHRFIDDKKTMKMIHDKYIEAVSAFATEYNKKNPSKPLTQINVGMGLNDLTELLKKHEKKSLTILKSINFSEFGGYNGDWQNEQYVIWINDEKNKGKKESGRQFL